MGMRVIGGEYRHRKLVYPESNKDIRPTKDRIREAFFSIVGNIENKLFLEPFTYKWEQGYPKEILNPEIICLSIFLFVWWIK